MDHQLLQSGPYALVRLPIYSGLLLALLGTAIYLGQYRALLGLALFGVFYFLSLYMQQILGYSPLTTAVAYLPFSGLLVVTAASAPILIGRIGARWLLVMGMLIAAKYPGVTARMSPPGPSPGFHAGRPSIWKPDTDRWPVSGK